MIVAKLRSFTVRLVAVIALLSGNAARPQAPPVEGQLRTQFDKAGITSLKFAGDKYDTDCIADPLTTITIARRSSTSQNQGHAPAKSNL